MNRSLSRRQAGFALFSALIFLVVLTVLAVAVLRSSTITERMAGNDLDRARAYQLAEATIRDAQQDILGLRANGQFCGGNPACRPFTDRPNKDAGLSDLSYLGTCLRGACAFEPAQYAAGGFVNPWDLPDPGVGAPARPYGIYGERTGADWVAIQNESGAAAQPRYWIEIFQNSASSDTFLYRITVRATGRNPNTVVTLQELYQP
jgi:type IV pilus assembly protein PilX